MEFGFTSKIEQYANNKAIELKKIKFFDKHSNISSDNLNKLYKENINQADNLNNLISDKRISNKNFYEVTLTNLNFGFNNQSKDFYIKTVKGKIENQYPTEQMMRMKAYIMSLA